MNKKEAAKVVRQWCKDHGIKAKQVLHVHPRSYVVGYAAPKCIIISECWHDSEHHLQEFVKKNPLEIIRIFDNSLKAGDFCISAYIVTEHYGDEVAVPIDYVKKP